MQTIAILNSKGGSGKTTVSTNLASYYAETGRNTVLIDYDSQGSSTHWVSTRTEDQASIRCIPAYQRSKGQTRCFQMRLDPSTDKVIIDTPAGISHYQLTDIVNRSNFIIIPVLPSSIDIHAVNGFIEQLFKLTRIHRGETKLAVIGNRTTDNTKIYGALKEKLNQMNIPFITKIRDTQHYTHSANQGKGLFELHSNHLETQNKSDWYPLLNWIDKKDCYHELQSHMTNTEDTTPEQTPLVHAV